MIPRPDLYFYTTSKGPFGSIGNLIVEAERKRGIKTGPQIVDGRECMITVRFPLEGEPDFYICDKGSEVSRLIE